MLLEQPRSTEIDKPSQVCGLSTVHVRPRLNVGGLNHANNELSQSGTVIQIQTRRIGQADLTSSSIAKSGEFGLL